MCTYHPTIVRIRPAAEDDLPTLADIFAASAGDLTERYWPEQRGDLPIEPRDRLPMYRHLLATGAMFVAEDPEPVGFSAAVVRDGVWFLSQLWVLPGRQRAGIGSRLLDEALAWGRGCTAFSVVASPHPGAQLLYLRASMYPLYNLIDLVGTTVPPPVGGDDLDALTEADQGWVDDLDLELRGIRRPEDHAFWRQHGSGLALRREDGPAGYVYVNVSPGKVGPGAARDPADLPPLLEGARRRAGETVKVTVPSTNWTALRELVRQGFVPEAATAFMASRPLPDGSTYVSGGGSLG